MHTHVVEEELKFEEHLYSRKLLFTERYLKTLKQWMQNWDDEHKLEIKDEHTIDIDEEEPNFELNGGDNNAYYYKPEAVQVQ